MNAATTQISARSRTIIFLAGSLLMTLWLFAIDSDSRTGGPLDPILAFTMFVGLFTSAQIGVSKLIGNSLQGWTKICASMFGGIVATIGLIFLVFTFLYLVKF